LPPAHTWAVEAARWSLSASRYWQLRIAPDEGPTVEQWQEAVRAKVAESVRLHLIADVPVGAFLSGGVDSSVIVASCEGVTNGPLQTFSMGFDEETISELPYAREVAERYRTRHQEETVTPDSVGLLDELARYYDEPFGDSSAVPTYLVSKMAARSVKVVLSGDGGDECFGGYRRYAHDLREAAIRRYLPRWFRRALGPIASGWPKADWLPRPLRLKTLLTNLSLDPGPAYANTLQVCRMPLRRSLLHADVKRQLNGHDPAALVAAAYAASGGDDPLGGMIHADVMTLLPDDYLVKVDRASMACGLEVRPPLLDHELLELTARIPSRLKVQGGQTKWLFKRAYEDRLPRNVLHRPKQGFEIPVDAWLRGPLSGRFRDGVLGTSGPLASLIDRGAVAALFEEHLRGVGRHGGPLWSLLVLSVWADRYLRASVRQSD
jgi:asparagine synthase (glutamine-hydrolysing)